MSPARQDLFVPAKSTTGCRRVQRWHLRTREADDMTPFEWNSWNKGLAHASDRGRMATHALTHQRLSSPSISRALARWHSMHSLHRNS